MKYKTMASITFLAITMASTVHAASGVTRAQVQAELAEVIRMGDTRYLALD